MKKSVIIFFLFLIVMNMCSSNIVSVKADELSDCVSDQLEKIDLSELDDFFNSLGVDGELGDLSEIIKGLLKGEYSKDYNSIFNYLIKIIMQNIKSFLPFVIGVLSIATFCGIIDKFKSSFSSEEISNIIFFVGFSGIILLLSKQIIGYYQETVNSIENISKLCEIMSPIILTLMTASGGKVSASIYSPSVAFLSGGIINIVLSIILPLVGFMTILNIVSNITTTVKLNKFAELASNTIKWILGIIFTVFTFFLSTQGIASATYDGISIKAAKYTISNSIPIVGGFLSGGFDLVVAGSVLIKNAIGVAVIFTLFYFLFSKILSMLVFSWVLKLLSAIVESISDIRISNICMGFQKCINYLVAVILIVALMFFITILLMLFSANAFL